MSDSHTGDTGSDTREFTLEQKLAVCRQVAGLVRAKLPIAGELAKATRASSPRVAELAQAVDQGISQGKSLESTLAHDQSPDSRVLAACIQAGEAADCLDAALLNWAGMHIANAKARKTMRAALLYPALLIAITLISLAFVVWSLIPQYRATYELLEHQLPNWLAAIVWIRERFGLFLGSLALLSLIPLVLWYWRRFGRNFAGESRDKGSRQRLQALSSEMAAQMLEQHLPLQQVVDLSVRIAGGTTEAAQQAFSKIQTHQPVPRLTSETSMLLAALHSGLMTPGDTVVNLRAVAAHLRTAADIEAAAQARWIPMLVALSVGMLTITTYVLLIYLPWIWLLQEIVDPKLPAGL